ncbi:class I SAM-dependent methyltransferase [Actinomadura fulvescens]|uniref:Class I SAM-dependent methyltransferase n=1 Tax=Actinomadura fulvescens TaxID=46160 RepID=A0ABN3Q112_9ACTN
MRVDTTGKISLDHIYTQPDPRAYFGTLRGLGYTIPDLAKPFFAELIGEYRDVRDVSIPTVLDIGCSYGINAALLRCDTTMKELYDRYGDAEDADRGELLAGDRELVDSHDRLKRTRFLGLDASYQALEYALQAGFIDGAMHADLEARDPTPHERERLAGVDLVISTGCVGYVTERTISRIVAVHGGRKPWMAHFVLRMFPFDPVTEVLAEAGYETVRHEGVFKQRRFATPEEQSLVLDRLAGIDVDPRGLETDGWFYAELFVSRPRDGGGRVFT